MTQFNIKLEETLFYEKLFAQCDVQKTGKVTGLDAYKLFLKSGLTIDDLKKICEYCGANRLGFFGRSQFYIALKMISLAQAGNVVDENILQKNVIHSLPRFDHEVNEEAFKTVQKSNELPSSIPLISNKYHMRTLSGNNILHNVPPTNRYSYSSPISKTMSQQATEKGSLEDSFPVKFDDLNKDGEDEEDEEEEEEEENVWDGYDEEDNKGLLDPDVKTDFNEFCRRKEDGEFSSSSSSSSSEEQHSSSSSSFSYGTDEEDCIGGAGVSADVQDMNPTGYTLMEAVEGLATVPTITGATSTAEAYNQIPVAIPEQLEYYTKCFHTIHTRTDNNSSNNHKVAGTDAISIFQMHNLSDGFLERILHLINITPESELTLIEFSKALHLITHVKIGFAIPEILPENLLPVEFEQPDEPFSFDLSDGEVPDVSNNYHTSSVESINSADDGTTGFDFTDVAVNRAWVRTKSQFITNNQYPNRSSKSFSKSKDSNARSSITNNNIQEETADVSRPRPCARKSLSLPQTISSTVAPPPPPRSSVPVEPLIKKLSIEKGTDPSGDSFSITLCSSAPKESDSHIRKLSESSKSEITNNVKQSNQDARKQLQLAMRELKNKNHVLLRLNNEMTSELEELREQRVNLHLQLEYIKQSQIDIQ